MVIGRRRVGKTTLVIEWMQRSGRPHLYWMAKNATPEALREDFAYKIWQWAYPNTPDLEPPTFRTWEQLFRELGRLIDASGKPLILVIDEFAFAVESDRSLPSFLQEAWDHWLKVKPLTLVLAGSHIGMLIDLIEYKAPLYGRITAELVVNPFPYAAVQDFLPQVSSVERVAVYSIVGGIPHYLERFKDTTSVVDSVRDHLFRSVGFFRSEPDQVLLELTRDSGRYLSILRAIAHDKRTSTEIADALKLTTGDVTTYIKRLRRMRLVERRLPVSIPPEDRAGSLRGRYHLSDPYLRFYYRFVEPHVEQIEQGLDGLTWSRISEQIRAYIGQGAFEEICRDWTLLQAQQHKLPFDPELIGSEWNAQAQIDVCAVNHREKRLLLGECKWTGDRIHRAYVLELIHDKTPKVLPDSAWQIDYIFFSRSGFTPDALTEIENYGGQAVTFARLDEDLRTAFMTGNA